MRPWHAVLVLLILLAPLPAGAGDAKPPSGKALRAVVEAYLEAGYMDRVKMREEADRDFDGRIDEITLFTNGRVSLQEIDTSGNGMIDTKIFYENGQPERAERDMANRSTAAKWQPDRWEYFEAGRTVRIGTDMNGDGKVDRWDRDEERLRESALNEDSAVNQ